MKDFDFKYDFKIKETYNYNMHEALKLSHVFEIKFVPFFFCNMYLVASKPNILFTR